MTWTNLFKPNRFSVSENTEPKTTSEPTGGWYTRKICTLADLEAARRNIEENRRDNFSSLRT